MAVKKGCLDCKANRGRECTECHRVRVAAWRVKKMKEGFCSHCCNTRPKPGKKTCERCILASCLTTSFPGLPKEAFKAKAAIKTFNGTCQCCGRSGVSKPHIEHDHVTGKFRGIVCGSCNLVMGIAKDKIAFFLSVISYLNNPPGYGIIPNEEKAA